MLVPDITNRHGLYSAEQLVAAVHVAGGLWVRLSDFAFELAGLGPRFGRVLEGKIDGLPVSWAYLDDGEDIYGLITADMEPCVLGAPREVLGDDGIYLWLDCQIVRWGRNLTRQQRILATAYAREIRLQIGDRVAARRVLSWVLTYERRAWWICRNLQKVYILGRAPDWLALGL